MMSVFYVGLLEAVNQLNIELILEICLKIWTLVVE